jgi:hypothetical protein
MGLRLPTSKWGTQLKYYLPNTQANHFHKIISLPKQPNNRVLQAPPQELG